MKSINFGGRKVDNIVIDINKLLEETVELVKIKPIEQLKRIDIDALLDKQVIYELPGYYKQSKAK